MFTLTEPIAQSITIPSFIQSQFQPLPYRHQIIVTQQFIGKGSQYSSKKKQRRQLEHQHQQLTNDLLLITRNNIKTNRQIDKQHQHIEYLIGIKKRKREELEEKRRMKEELEKSLGEMGRKITEMKESHKEKLDMSTGEILMGNRQDYMETKKREMDLSRERRQNIRKDLQIKRNKSHKVNCDKYLGLRRMVDYKTHKNRKHLKQYNIRIQQQQNNIAYLTNEISQLHKDKISTNQLLSTNQDLSQQLKSVIETSSTADIYTLSKYSKPQSKPTPSSVHINRIKYNRSISYNSNSKNSRISYHTETYERPERKRQLGEGKMVGERGRRSLSHEREPSREEKIEKTVELLERSDIYSIIKGESWASGKELKGRKGVRSKSGNNRIKGQKMMSKRSFERLYKLE